MSASFSTWTAAIRNEISEHYTKVNARGNESTTIRADVVSSMIFGSDHTGSSLITCLDMDGWLAFGIATMGKYPMIGQL